MVIVPLLGQTVPKCIFSADAKVLKILRKMNIVKSNVIGIAPVQAILSKTLWNIATFTQAPIVDTAANMTVNGNKERQER